MGGARPLGARDTHHPCRSETVDGYRLSDLAQVRDRMRLHPSYATSLRSDHDLADDLAILDEAQALARLLERQDLVDHRLHLAFGDELHQCLQALVVEAVGADDLQLEAPDVAQVLFRVVPGGGAADQELAAALEAAQRGMPSVAAGEVDHHVDAALISAPLRLAIFLHRPLGEVGVLDVEHLIGPELLELL